MEGTFEQIAGIRLLAHQGLLQNIIRNWGRPAGDLLRELQRSREALTVSMLQSGATDAQIEALHVEYDVAIGAVNALIAGLPDDRPDPI